MEFKTKPFPHQLEAFERFKDHNYVALLADMGTGKSKIAIDLCTYKYRQHSQDRVLVIAPNAVHPQWVDEQFPVHCGCDWKGFSYSSKKTVKFLRSMDRYLMSCKGSPKLCVFTMNFEAFAYAGGLAMAHRFLSTSRNPPMIIVDEASRIKNPSAKTVKAIKQLRKNYLNSFRLVLTGTPAAKSPVDMWSIYDFLKERYMGCSYTAFKYEHSVIVKKALKIKGRIVKIDSLIDPKTFQDVHKMIKNNIIDGKIDQYVVQTILRRFGLSERDFWFIASSEEFRRFKDVKKLQERIAPHTFAVSKADCLELPEKPYKRVELKLNPTQMQLIKDLGKYSATRYNEKELTIEVKALLGLRVLQICGGFFSHHTDIEGKFAHEAIKGKNAKMEYIKEDLQEIGNQQFICWAVFSPEIQLIYNTLRPDYAVGILDGSVDKKDRPEIIADFKAGRLQGLISHPEVGGYGLNLQGAGIQYWYSRNYRTEARLQAEDRSHRIGTTVSPIYKDLVYNVVFEHRVLQSLKEGLDINSNFMSSDINELFKIM